MRRAILIFFLGVVCCSCTTEAEYMAQVRKRFPNGRIHSIPDHTKLGAFLVVDSGRVFYVETFVYAKNTPVIIELK